MLPLPGEISTVMRTFKSSFTRPSWEIAKLLLTGALLCAGPRRISCILRVMGLSSDRAFGNKYRFFNRAAWHCLMLSKILLTLLLAALPPNYPILMVVDDTLERRKGRKITDKGRYRDACRSTKQNVVTAYGLKWLCVTLLVPSPFSQRPWALPVLTLLQPSKKANQARNRKHRTCIDWSITAVNLLSRWLKRQWVLIGDGAFACVKLGHHCNNRYTILISRLRLDSALYEFPNTPSEEEQRKRGRPAEKGKRLPALKTLADDPSQTWQPITVTWYGGEQKTLEILTGTALWYTKGEKPLPIKWVLTRDPEQPEQGCHAFFSTELSLDATCVIEWFVLRWNIEVTFEEIRSQLGFETQRHWSKKSINRVTPILMGLYSLVFLFALERMKKYPIKAQSTAWYKKTNLVTFSDLLVFIRQPIWRQRIFGDSPHLADYAKNDPD